MPLIDAGSFHVTRILVAEIAVADTLRGAVEAKRQREIHYSFVSQQVSSYMR